MIRLITGLIFVITTSSSWAAGCSGGEMENGWCWPTGTSQIGSFIGWHGLNPNFLGKKHLAQDIDANEGDDILAIADGTVIYARTNVSGYGGVNAPGGGIIIRHKTGSGEEFDSQNAHVKNFTVSVGDQVVRGQKIGEIGPYSGGSVHLHFGIRYPANDDSNRWAGYALIGESDLGFVDPIAFLNTHSPKITPYTICGQPTCNIDSHTFSNGDIVGWYPKGHCDEATKWFGITEVNGAYEPTSSLQPGDVCMCR